MTRVHLYFTQPDLTAQRRICAQQQLLSRLSAGIERARYLCPAERTVVEQSAVFAGKRYALRHALVDNGIRYFGQTVHVGFTGTIVAPFNRVIEQTVYRIAVVLIILGRIDPSLRSNRVCTTRRILNTEVKYVKPHLGQRGGS